MPKITMAERCRIWRQENPDRAKTYSLERRSSDPVGWVSDLMFRNARARAKKKELPFEITLKWVRAKVARGVCEATGVGFDLAAPSKNFYSPPRSPSIDRKDCLIGYTKENSQVVSWIYNRAKGDASHEDVVALAKAILGTRVEDSNEKINIAT